LPSSSSSSSKNCWVLAYGHNTETQREELLTRFSKCGRIVEQRRCGPNATALRYESDLQAAKACSMKPITLTLRDGSICGAQPISDHDPRLTQAQSLFGTGVSQQPNLLTMDATTGSTADESSTLQQPMTEDDILLVRPGRGRTHHASGNSSNRPQRSLCEKILRWFLSIPDY